ncbi:MAG: MOSC domain-containing protein [Bdellovibrionales bacterium]|nr:MOSC domain-containing protein [Bdellovibrionales bacterium]
MPSRGDRAKLELVKECERCGITTVDQERGAISKNRGEPLRTLNTYRRQLNGKVIFGQNAIVIEGAGQELSVADVGEFRTRK